MDKLSTRLKSFRRRNATNNIHIMSAAISGEEGLPIDNDARKALEYLGVPVLDHKSQRLSVQIIARADKIWCMSSEHKQLILEKFPEAGGKVNCLDEKEGIPVPHGKGVSAYIECARKLEEIIDNLIFRKEISIL
jgi:protein-tyrosine phosphatase